MKRVVAALMINIMFIGSTSCFWFGEDQSKKEKNLLMKKRMDTYHLAGDIFLCWTGMGVGSITTDLLLKNKAKHNPEYAEQLLKNSKNVRRVGYISLIPFVSLAVGRIVVGLGNEFHHEGICEFGRCLSLPGKLMTIAPAVIIEECKSAK